MLIEDEINSKGRHFLRKLGHRWLRIRIVKNANPSHLISLSPDKKLALNLNLVPLLSAGDGPFVFFWKHEFLASLKHFYSHFSLVRYASYRDWMKAFNLILINTDAPHFRRGWSWTLAARMAFSRRSKKKADNGSIGGETRWSSRLLSSSSVVKIFFCFTMCLMLEKMGRMSRDDRLLIAKMCRLSRQGKMVLMWMLGLHKYLQFITFWSKSKRGELLSVERQGGENDISFTQCLCDIKSGKIYF